MYILICLPKYLHVLYDTGNSTDLTAQKCQDNWHKLNIQIWRCVVILLYRSYTHSASTKF